MQYVFIAFFNFMSKAHFGLIGLGVMGENLVLNEKEMDFLVWFLTEPIQKPKNS